jgi:Flp pilus assembly protein TadB
VRYRTDSLRRQRSSFNRQIAAGQKTGRRTVLETIIVVLVILWLLGVVSSYTMGGFIHILLVLALIVLVIRVFQGRRL